MDYLILAFLAVSILVFIIFKMKLALLDAATPKFGGYPAGNPAGGMQNNSIHNRYKSNSYFPLFLMFGFILLIMYFMYRTGHDPRISETALEKIFQTDSPWDTEPGYESKPFDAPESQIAKEKKSYQAIPRDRINQSPLGRQVADYEVLNLSQKPVRKIENNPVDNQQVTHYWLQLGAYNERRFANECAVNSIPGYETKIHEEDNLYKVRIGPFMNKSEANSYKNRFKECTVVPVRNIL